jgi:hypothetical protein
LRDLVWDGLHGDFDPARVKDVDLAFCDPLDLSHARGVELERALAAHLRGVTGMPRTRLRSTSGVSAGPEWRYRRWSQRRMEWRPGRRRQPPWPFGSAPTTRCRCWRPAGSPICWMGSVGVILAGFPWRNTGVVCSAKESRSGGQRLSLSPELPGGPVTGEWLRRRAGGDATGTGVRPNPLRSVIPSAPLTSPF